MTPKDKALYAKVKAEADAKFLAPTSVYKSAWIVSQYKKRGGVYIEDRPPKNQGLVRWFKEKWVNVNRPIHQKNETVGYEPCGRSAATTLGTYPLCRPSVRVNNKTPKTIHELPAKVIQRANKEKQKVKETQHIRFEKRKPK